MELSKAENFGHLGMLHLRVLITGDLQVSISEDDRGQLVTDLDVAYDEGHNWYWVMNNLFSELDNAGLAWFGTLSDCPDIVALTGSPGIYDWHVNGDDRVWWYPNYVFDDPFDDLIENGETIFTLAQPMKELDHE